MIEVQIDNLFVVQNQIERLGRGLDDNRYLLMKKLAGTMNHAVRQNFRQSGRPKWLGIEYRNGKPLIDTGALRDNINQAYDNDTALVGTNIVYAAIHNFGGMAGRNRKVRIPARPFLVLTNEDKQDLMDDVQDYFRQLIS
ncbi:phage virion morphogenesis protein [Kingella negevensis]|uniref:Phage virion morphogenesis family protein n=1 Tax=Kingella negevensis TaxID=1522312 RepID=A0A238TFW5_9NEIS|nr:phage virion morphogenesis protein [Kingella negevensis]MDK4680621.1 phage virion morphogenesis protein [Kingella negevensis]MDK4681656.1 phage virion morphogenesis protein [Kingella negevensis]MDK4685599.1 phage virion morphogenesis protein [Kingella negevensis]MDK4689854.1 phage virion morphogenesis protein [Kingella negevensis]MDK4692802.1 phage virion morphogenesis protein [Kingella negevensis]